jgi:hypothetical protein
MFFIVLFQNCSGVSRFSGGCLEGAAEAVVAPRLRRMLGLLLLLVVLLCFS